MKNLSPLFILLIFLSSCQTDSSKDNFPEEEENKKYPNEWFYAQRAFPRGEINKAAYQNALQYRQQVQSKMRGSGQLEEWEFEGPTNIGGRITDLEMPSNSLETIYAASASGGIFKSENTGQTWTPIFDDAMSLSIGDMEMAPSDNEIIYVGTGEPNAGGGSLAYDGVGIYKTLDGGNNWQHLGLENIGSVGKIEVSPNDPEVAFVAAMGDLFGKNPERGVFRTTNGGTSWEQVLFVSDSTGFVDLAMHPTNPNIIFAAAWERIRRPEYRRYTGASSGIYRTVDGGENWELLTNGLPTLPEDKGRIGLAISPSDPNYVYAYIVNSDGDLSGIFRSTDGGDNWGIMHKNGINEPSFMWWFGKMYVHPESPNTLIVLSLHVHYIQNIETDPEWQTRFQGAHVDQHAIFIHPLDPDFFLAGNDGGVYLSQNRGFSYNKLDGLPITQFYRTSTDFQNPEQVYGGTQDNGTMRTLSGNLDDFEIILGGDGFFPLIDPENSDLVYAEFQYGNLRRSVDGGNNFFNATNGFSPDRVNWNTPVIFDPNDSDILYMGGNRLYKSTNNAFSWSPISEDLSDGGGNGNLAFGTITTISVSPFDSENIMVGTDDGNVWITENGGTDWNNVSDGLPKFWITQVELDPVELGVAYVTISGFRFYDETAHVFKTTDSGNSWEPISGELPNIPVNDIIINPTNHDLYIATDIGVFKSINDGNSWGILGTGLPNVVVTDLSYHEPTNTLLAGTFGRSMYSVEVDIDVANNNLEISNFDIVVFPNPFSDNSNITFTIPTSEFIEINIINTTGQILEKVVSQELTKGKHQFSFGKKEWSAGIYFLQIMNKNGGIIKTEKIIKR
ncbi:MAG: T9SS type A sorting domain-containing protein [Saprospiraceae bacterium]